MFEFRYIAAFFMFYATAGWCVEVIYKTTSTGKFVNRGFLNGPLCPIYGVGVIGVILCLSPIKDNLLLLYISSVGLTTLLEFVTGLILEKVFHQKWWDYKNEPFNIKGYVCLKFSLLWGLACVFVMRIIQPLIMIAIERIPENVGNAIMYVYYGLMIADMIVTIAALSKITLHLKIANDIDALLNRVSEAIGSRLTDGTEKVQKRLTKAQKKLAKAQKKFGEQFNPSEHLNAVHRRLEKAYPNLDFKRLDTAKLIMKFREIKERYGKTKENHE